MSSLEDRALYSYSLPHSWSLDELYGKLYDSEQHSYGALEVVTHRNSAHYRIFQLSDKLADLTTGVEALLSQVSACKVR